MNRLVLRLLGSLLGRWLGRSVLGLEVTGRVSGRRYRLPVQYADGPDGLVVVPGRPATKTWWRNLGPEPRAVRVLRDGRWTPARARVSRPGDASYSSAAAAYLHRWPRTTLPADQPVVVVDGQRR